MRLHLMGCMHGAFTVNGINAWSITCFTVEETRHNHDVLSVPDMHSLSSAIRQTCKRELRIGKQVKKYLHEDATWGD